ncbi:MAG: PD-(D/E)XK nuclease family protein [Sulfurisoma sp.]|nr:PD-(D/E)XK nuclease family protein [Sulfurisoma sp.]
MERKRNKTVKATLTQRLLQLIAETDFVRLEHLFDEPNIFKIVGRTHYERWHSCFWGWLLDPNGSHLLSSYPLSRLVLLLGENSALPSCHAGQQDLLVTLANAEYGNVSISPNENDSTETGVTGVGRFDIFLSADVEDIFEAEHKLNLLVELKVDSAPNADQSKRYADWLFDTHPSDINLAIYFLPKLGETAAVTVGDNRWNCVSYQLLHDKLLLPLFEHPSLNPKTAPFIAQYMKNMRHSHRGVKMAITEEERRIASALYDKYSDVFDAIYEALLIEKKVDYDIKDAVEPPSRESGRIAVQIDGTLFMGEPLKVLFEKVLKYLVDSKLISKLPLPWGKSGKRYALTNLLPATHPSGRPFFYPIEYKSYVMESHYSRSRGLAILEELSNQLEVPFSTVDA